MLNPTSGLPLYYQLKQQLRHEIEAGRWATTEPIPSERALIERYRVSRTTVRQALAELVSEGLLSRRHGKGTFLAAASPAPAAWSPLMGHVEELQERGVSPEVCVGRIVIEPSPPAAAAALELADGEPAQAVHRLVLLDGEPLAKMEAWFPLSLGLRFSAEELRAAPLSRILGCQGVSPAHGRQSVRAVSAPPFEADLLGLPAHGPVLAVERTLYSSRNRPLEWSRALYHPERYAYIVELRSRAETAREQEDRS